MNGIFNENKLTVVKEYEFKNPLIQNIDSIIDKCYRDCHYKYYHTFQCECVYDPNFTIITNNEIVDFKISDKNLGMYELNKKLSIARQRGYIFNQINNFKIKIYSNISYMNIDYRLKLSITSPLFYNFFKSIARNHDYIQTHCNDINNSFHVACRLWYSYNNQGILT